jgi:hypothetical protein
MYDPIRHDAQHGDGSNTTHCRFYEIAGIRIQVRSDLPIEASTFSPHFEKFAVPGPTDGLVTITHHFSLPLLDPAEIGPEYRRARRWRVYHRNGIWTYVERLDPDSETAGPDEITKVSVFDEPHLNGTIYHPDAGKWRAGGLDWLCSYPCDQVYLARVLADREGCYFHSSGIALGNRGLLFIGHSGAGKSTIKEMLMSRGGEGLGEDRSIVRRRPDGYRIHGTWHGNPSEAKPTSVSLGGIFLIEQAETNRLIPLTDRREIARLLPSFIIRPVVTEYWWHKTLELVGMLARDIPVYRLQFDLSGEIGDLIEGLCDAVA